MSIDIYQPCPCHEDKKIKFCCGKSIVGHLNDAIDKSSSNQPQAALERINRAIEQEGPKSCLLTIKGSLLLDLGEIEQANETVNEFLEQNPTMRSATCKPAWTPSPVMKFRFRPHQLLWRLAIGCLPAGTFWRVEPTCFLGAICVTTLSLVNR